ncbi:gamma-glutamyl-gamma-aminobutyrate hydrolase family protein [Cohnella panacarvi]|uniref:gamma-glutamyl-gamma-aminobutyrate hydrolase family protein n=1 Tax=Cohnella panacarvi TaxID=400776 RepID=UPI00047D25D4|nr:gamma-glutamyl-gamma-aminobutyrate hydrolase family protein [Cohnella panacarvi]
MIAVITQRVIQDPLYGEIRDALSHEWYSFLKAAGFDLVIPIPNTGKSVSDWIKHVKPDLIVLSGGNNVEYGQLHSETSSPLSKIRDESEAALLEVACSGQIPVLGVCRGMQFIYAYFGGQLLRKSGHVAASHEIKLNLPNDADPMEWKSNVVNSYHNYCIGSHLPECLQPIGYHVGDHTIEAFVHRDYPMLGVMWHPERNKPYSKLDIELIHTILRFPK